MVEDRTINDSNASNMHFKDHESQCEGNIRSKQSRASVPQRLILIFAVAFLLVLSIASVVITVEDTSVTRINQVLVTCNYILPVLVGLLVWGIVIIITCRYGSFSDEKKIAHVGFIVATSFSVIWVFVSNSGPTYDSMDLSCAAWAMTDSTYVPLSMLEWRDHGEDIWGIGWEDPVPSQESYMGKYPFQSPFVILLMLCQRLAGSNFALLYQLINAIANGLIWYNIVLLSYDITRNIKCALIAFEICILFNPIIYFATFIYGNTLGLALALIAWHLTCKAFDDGQSVLKRLMILSVATVFLASSVLVKQTLILVSIAFAVSVVLYCINRRDLRFIPVILIPFILSSAIGNEVINRFEEISGTNLHNAPPKLTWIVMGIGGGRELQAIQDNNPDISNDLAFPGYYDSYVTAHPQLYGFSSWDEMNKLYLKKRIEHYQRDPSLMLKFFCKKLAIEWLEPTAECFVVSNYIRQPGDFATYLADTNRVYTRYARSFYYGKMHTISVLLDDCAQSIIAIGALFWAIMAYKDCKKDYSMSMIGIILILGGALLYIFWENKTQYILPFWTFMIPYAASGWFKLTAIVSMVRHSD